MAYKQKPIKFGEGTGSDKDDKFLKEQNESKVKSTDYLTKTPVGPRAKDTKVDPFSKEEADIENKSNDPGTVPLFSDDAHDKVKAKKKKKGAPNMKTGKYKHNF